jgi:putative membrane protein
MGADRPCRARSDDWGPRAAQKVVPDGLVGATSTVLILSSSIDIEHVVWRQIDRVAPPKLDTPRLSVWLLIAINAFLLVVASATLIGIWLS